MKNEKITAVAVITVGILAIILMLVVLAYSTDMAAGAM